MRQRVRLFSSVLCIVFSHRCKHSWVVYGLLLFSPVRLAISKDRWMNVELVLVFLLPCRRLLLQDGHCRQSNSQTDRGSTAELSFKREKKNSLPSETPFTVSTSDGCCIGWVAKLAGV